MPAGHDCNAPSPTRWTRPVCSDAQAKTTARSTSGHGVECSLGCHQPTAPPHEEFVEHLAPELHGIHKLLFAVDAKLKHWRAKNSSCMRVNTLSVGDIHMVIHTIKFFSPGRAAWRLTHDLFSADFTRAEMHHAACNIQCQPLRDNVKEWITQHYRLIMALIDEEKQPTTASQPVSQRLLF